MTDWQDMIVGDRMTVDEEFSSRVDDSQFTRQEWGLVMTAVTFEIENPEDESKAKIVANTSELRSMMPEIEKVADMNPMGAQKAESDSGGGLFGSVLDALGLNSRKSSTDSTDEEKLSEAKALVSAYADELQARLESEGRWSEVREKAAEE
jgi:hypothetical protein